MKQRKTNYQESPIYRFLIRITVCFDNTVQKFLMFKEHLKHHCLQFSYNLLVSNFTAPDAKCTVQYSAKLKQRVLNYSHWELAFSRFSTEKKEKGFLKVTVMNKPVLPPWNSLAPRMQARLWASTWKTAGWHILHAPSFQFTISLKNKASKTWAKSKSR